MKKHFLVSILSFLMAAIIAVISLASCSSDGSVSTGSQSTQTVSAAGELRETSEKDVGEGSKVFVFEVTDDKNYVSRFNVHTDEKTIADALLKTGLIEGEASAYGLYVKSVNGITADYNTDKAYWAFYVNGEYATSGVDSTNIEADKTYAFVYTKE